MAGSRVNLLLCGAAFGGLLQASAALPAAAASPSPSAASEVSEVVVTATGRKENIQSVPITVSVVDAEILKQQNITRVSELKYTIPSLTVAPSFNTLNNAFSIRGLAAGVSTYFADANCCTAGSAVPFMDVANIQVLNGPQGTLFGRTSGSGSILISPNMPNLGEMDGDARLTLGDYGRVQFNGAVSLPLIKDQVGLRLAVSTNNLSGFTRQIGKSERLDEENSQQVRLSLLVRTDRVDSYSAIHAVNLDQRNSNAVLAAINVNGIALYNLPAAAGPAVFGAACNTAVGFGAYPNQAACVSERLSLLAAQKAALINEMNRINTGGRDAVRSTPAIATPGQPSLLRLKDWSLLNRTEFRVGELGPLSINLKNVISYENIVNNTSGSADGIGGLAQNAGAFNTAGVGGNNTNGRKVVAQLGPYARIFSNDFKVEIDGFDKALVSTVGYFYQKTTLPATEKGTGNIYTIFGGTTTPFLNYLSAQGFQAGSYAVQTGVYGQATFDFTNLGLRGLKFTGGYRYSQDEQVDRRRAAVITYPQAIYTPGARLPETRLKTNGYNYNLSLTQEIGQDLMVYVSQTRAYIPGGINVLIQGNTNLPNYKPIYDPQTIIAREIGAKYDFRVGDMVGRLNAAAYYYDFQDIAVGFSGFTGTASVAYTANVAAAELKGFEIYGNIVPLENWQVRGSYNYNDAHYKKWLASDPFNAAKPGDAICSPKSQPLTCLIDLSNNPFQRMPAHQGNLTLVYTPPIDPTQGALSLSASVYAQSQVWFNSAAYRHLQVLPTAKPGIYQKGYAILNLRADWSDVWGKGFDAAVFVNNSTDEVYKNGTTAQLLTLGYAIATYAPPRMIGIEIGKRF